MLVDLQDRRVPAVCVLLPLVGIIAFAVVAVAWNPPRGALVPGMILGAALLFDVLTLLVASLLAALDRWGRPRSGPNRLLRAGALGSAFAVLPTLLYALVLPLSDTYTLPLLHVQVGWLVPVVGGAGLVGAVVVRLIAVPVLVAGLVWYAGVAVSDRF